MTNSISIFVFYYYFSLLIEKVDSIAKNDDCGDNKYMHGEVSEVNAEAKKMKKLFEEIKNLDEETLYAKFLLEEITGSDDEENDFDKDSFKSQVEKFSNEILVKWLYGEKSFEEDTLQNLKSALDSLLEATLKIRRDEDFRDNMNNFEKIIADFIAQTKIDFESITNEQTFETKRLEQPYNFYMLYSLNENLDNFIFNAVTAC